jgi:hypothetical protein
VEWAPRTLHSRPESGSVRCAPHRLVPLYTAVCMYTYLAGGAWHPPSVLFFSLVVPEAVAVHSLNIMPPGVPSIYMISTTPH